MRPQFKLISDSIVTELYTKTLSTKVGAVTEEYSVHWESNEVSYIKGSRLEKNGFIISYSKQALEDYTGVLFEGKYQGKDFSRSLVEKKVDSLAYTGNL